MYRFTGLALPYDVVAKRALRRWSFAPNAIAPGSGCRLLRDHDEAQRLGHVTLSPEAASGLIIRARTSAYVAVGMGLSVGVIPVEVRRVRGVFTVYQAVLDEISIVSAPAYPECVITEVQEEM